MKFSVVKIVLVLIISLAAFLRFWQLGTNPPSLTWDEVAWGYNAYSLGIDGRDEFGKFLPIQYLESFGDFKPPVYAYLAILPVKIFGLNEFATRFPSAFLGTLTVFITYFLTKRILFSQYSPPRSPFGHLGGVAQRLPRSETVALLSALFLAISPWHINLSRAAFEANVATFFLVAGVWLFLGGVRERKWYLPLSAVSFILSMYTFNTARVVAPLLIFGLAIGFKKELLVMKKYAAIAMVIGAILLPPLAQFLTTPQAKLRFHEVNIFSDIRVIERTNREIANDGNAWWARLIHNRRIAYAAEYLRHYFDHFNPAFLFIKGDGNPKFSTQDVGQLYLWDLPFLVIGVLLLFKRREGFWWIVPLWVFIGIIPAGTARETPHALRIETTLPAFQILVAYGFYQVVLRSKYYVSSIKIHKYIIPATLYLILLMNFLYYYHGYYAHYTREFSGEWQYGYKESISYVASVKDNFDQINITEDLGRPYMYYLFYTKISPSKFRKTAIVEREALGFVNVKGLDKFRFDKDLSKIKSGKKTLYIDVYSKVPQSAEKLKIFYLLNGKPVLTAYTL